VVQECLNPAPISHPYKPKVKVNKYETQKNSCNFRSYFHAIYRK
jgi:hypothetical protein